MKTTALITSLSVLFLASVSQASASLDLACIATGKSAGGMIVRQIIIEDERTSDPLTDSDENTAPQTQFAMVIETVGGDNGTAPRQQWDILQGNEFKLKQVDDINFTFKDLKNRIVYSCTVNGIVDANPALTRTN